MEAEKNEKGKGTKRKVEDPLKPKGEPKSTAKAKAAPKSRGRGRGRGRGKAPLAESPHSPVIRKKAKDNKKLSEADAAALAEMEVAAAEISIEVSKREVDPDMPTPKKTLFEGDGTPHYERREPASGAIPKPKASAKAKAKAKAEGKAAAKSKAKARPKAKASPVAEPDDGAEPPARRSRKGSLINVMPLIMFWMIHSSLTPLDLNVGKLPPWSSMT